MLAIIACNNCSLFKEMPSMMSEIVMWMYLDLNLGYLAPKNKIKGPGKSSKLNTGGYLYDT